MYYIALHCNNLGVFHLLSVDVLHVSLERLLVVLVVLVST